MRPHSTLQHSTSVATQQNSLQRSTTRCSAVRRSDRECRARTYQTALVHCDRLSHLTVPLLSRANAEPLCGGLGLGRTSHRFELGGVVCFAWECRLALLWVVTHTRSTRRTSRLSATPSQQMQRRRRSQRRWRRKARALRCKHTTPLTSSAAKPIRHVRSTNRINLRRFSHGLSAQHVIALAATHESARTRAVSRSSDAQLWSSVDFDHSPRPRAAGAATGPTERKMPRYEATR